MTALTDLQVAEGLVDRNPAEALRLTSRVLAKAQKENQLELALETHLVRGKVFSRQGEFSEGLAEQMEALRLAQQIPDQAMEARCHKEIGWSQGELGNHVQAMESLEHSLKQFRLFKNEALAAQVQHHMGVVWGRIGEHGKGLHLIEAALPQLLAQPDASHYGLALSNRVWLQLEQLASKDEKLARTGLEKTLSQLDQALNIAYKLEDKHLERQTLLVRAKAFNQASKAADAQFVLEQVLKQAKAARDIQTQMLALWDLAISYQGMGHLGRALEPLLEALKLAQGHKHYQLPQLHLLLSQLYEQSHDPVEALRHFKVFYQLSQKTSSSLQEQRQLEELKNQIENLGQELQQQRREIEELTLHNRQLSLQAKTLERQATQDALTGLSNRFYLEHRLEQVLQQGRSAAIVMVDIDHFKTIIQRFGRTISDTVLKTVAQLLRLQCRDSDVIARLGGEEIAIMLYQADPRQAHEACERMRQGVEQHNWTTVQDQLGVTISLGYALAFQGNDVIQEADGYLLEAKNLGGNRVYPARK